MEHFSPLPPSPSPQAVLFHSEELASQPFPYVGLYESNTKLPAPLDVLTVHLSTHRILLAVPPNPPASSAGPSSPSSSHVRSTFPHGLSIPLSHIRQTEFYAGFLTSSAKVTLYLASSVTTTTTSSSSSPIVPSSSPSILSPTPTPSSSRASSTGWPCPLCGFANPQPPPGATDKMVKCQMCGVSKEASMAAVPSSRPSSTHFSTSASTPSSTPPPPSPDIDPTSTGGEIACPICTFLNHSSLRECEMCSSPLPSRSTRSGPPPPSASQPVVVVPSASIPGGGGPEKLSTVRLSFRRGGEKEFYKLLKRALADRAWAGGEPRLTLNTSTTNGGSPSASGTSTPVEGRPGVGGIDRILNTLSVEDATRSTSIDTSLRDLESLMAKASEMVKLASSLSLRLQQTNNSTPGDASSAASQEIHSTLLQLGLAAPAVTQDMVTSKEEGAYLRELAKELGGLLTGEGGLMVDTRRGGAGKGKKGRGLIGLDEVWCAWNRARGVALIPPKTLPLLLPLLSQFTTPPISPLTLRRTRQTLLHTPYHSPSSFRSRLLRTLTAPASSQPSSLPSPTTTSTQNASSPPEAGVNLATESLSLIELALAEDIGVGVAGELVWELEMKDGEVVRDSQGGAGAGGERWWANWMKGVEWREVNDFGGR